MHKSATKCNETLGKWYKNKHGASKIIDMLETYHPYVLPSCIAPRYLTRCIQCLGYRYRTRQRWKNLLCLARASDWGSFLWGSYLLFYSAKVLPPVINLGKGLPQTRQSRGIAVVAGLGLRREEALVHESGWGRLMSFPGALHHTRRSLLESSNRHTAFMQVRQGWSLPCRGNMDVVLSSLSYPSRDA
jgi:hypothetical protein